MEAKGLAAIIISPPCLAACRRCTTCEQKEEPGPRRFADFCAPTGCYAQISGMYVFEGDEHAEVNYG